MRIPLICHWRGDGDIARAFLEYYAESVSEFHLILHGPDETNRAILALRTSFPITIHAVYDSRFDSVEKARRLNQLMPSFMGQWVLVVDSDEFVELPYSSVRDAIRELERSHVSCMAAPMLQRLRRNGSLESPEIVRDAFGEFPLCSERLYEMMGSTGCIDKYPLFRCGPETSIGMGPHCPPNGADSVSDAFRGVTHHFKWRNSAIERISYRIEIGSPWAETESVSYLKYLTAHDFLLPLDDAFIYSRGELFRRRLLRRPSFPIGARLSSWSERLRNPRGRMRKK